MTNRYPWAVAAHKELSGVVGNQEDQEIVLGLHQTFDEERANGNCMKDDDLRLQSLYTYVGIHTINLTLISFIQLEYNLIVVLSHTS